MTGQRLTTGLRALALTGAMLCAIALVPSRAYATVNVEVLSTGGGTSGPPSNTYPNETLADAVAYTESHGGGTITFAPSLAGQTINLSTSLAQISADTTITGPTSANVVINGGGTHALFDAAPSTSLTVSGLMLTDGSGTSGGPSEFVGGAIFGETNSTVVVKNCLISGNTVNTAGGAIASEGTVDIEDSTISGNQAAEGGGLYGLAVTISGSTFLNNTAFAGGGVFAAGNLTISDSTFNGNHAQALGGEGGGGAILAYLSVASSGVQITSSTISGNEADGTSGAPAGGGGIYINANAPGHAVQLLDTIVAGNTGPLGPDIATAGSAPAVGASFSLIGNPSDDQITGGTSTDLIGTQQAPLDPKLGAPAYNGGPTPTMLPLAGSPAIDAGIAPSGITTDQRGDPRTVKLGFTGPSGADGTDIGAVELQASELGAPTVTHVSPSLGAPGTNVTITGTNLYAATQVMFGSIPATAFTAVSATEITATVPSGTVPITGVVQVHVVTPSGASTGGNDAFIYTATKITTTFDNQQLTLTAPVSDACVQGVHTLTASFSSKIVPGSKARKLKFRSVAFYIDKGVKAKHGRRYLPNAFYRKGVTVHLKVKSGMHTLRVVATYAEQVKHRTRTVTKTLKTRFPIC